MQGAGRMRLKCFSCGKIVSSKVPAETIVRAIIVCPECLEKEGVKKMNRVREGLFFAIQLGLLCSLCFLLGLMCMSYTCRPAPISLQQEEDCVCPECPEYERLQLYDKENLPNLRVNGLYFPSDEYYCVWAKNRTPINVAITEAHEYCHHLTYTDWEHFCLKSKLGMGE